MTSRKNLVVVLTIVLGILAVNGHARSWDLAIVIGREVEFLARNQTVTGQAKLAEAVTLSGVAYDDTTKTMYFSDVSNNNITLFSNDLRDKNFTLKPLLKKHNKSSYIIAIVFDTSRRTLFWSDPMQGVIMKMHVPLDGPPDEPTILHNLTHHSPRGIALDACNSHIYWVNSNNTNPSIERSDLDGGNRVTVIKENLYEPLAVAVDHSNKKLYWIDDAEGVRINMERSNLDGSERELLVHPKGHQPVHLALDNDSIYWSDLVHRAVWTIPKDAKLGDLPSKFRSYQSNHDAEPAGIVTRDNLVKADCSAGVNVKPNLTVVHLDETSYNNLTTSTEESEPTTETFHYCLNDGHIDENEGKCQCRLGFTGTHCDVDLCHNYCFRGSCNINSDGLPTCRCNDTFIGPRCETDLCKDYCLHDGQCSVQDEKPVCKCKYSEGARCEILSNTELCEVFCANTGPVPTSVATANCGCAERNQESAQMVTAKEDNEYRTILPILSVIVGVLVFVIAVLSYYVNKFRKRPRIKKRFVVSKGGVTPLTSRPQLPDNQCEITIENCCNMNICETPCFEPKLRAAAPGTNGSKKEEKNSLLDNMEENSW
ncbi:hypothetical protein QLX08_010428 [Tetragonisca angustula]|uniref:Protein cueball n=1 Tax=Tetragonisca angustula TaxID=166442 RepID=A0AAW0ZCI5_9HYME